MADSSPLFTGIYAKLPNILKLIVEDIIVFVSFYFLITSFNLFWVTAAGISVSILLMKYLYKIAVYYLPANGRVTARSGSFTTFSLAFLFVTFLLRFLESRPEIITYCLIFIAILWTFVVFYKQNKPENARVSAAVFFLMKLSKIAIKLVLILLLLFIINAFFIDMHLIPTGSMSPTVHSNEVILSDKLFYKAHTPKRWDSAILKHAGYDYKMLKRIVGMPGEKIEIAGGNVIVDGKVLVRPQDVLKSQMQKAPISYISFEDATYHDEDKNRKIQMQFAPDKEGSNKEDWKDLLKQNFGLQAQTQSRPINDDELVAQFVRWWSPSSNNKENHSDHIRLLSIKDREGEYIQFVNVNSTKTDVNNLKKLTDDIAVQMDSRFINPKEFAMGFRSYSIDEVVVYVFIINFDDMSMKVEVVKVNKNTRNVIDQKEETFNLRNYKLRNKMHFQIIDGLPIAIINEEEYRPKFEPIIITSELETVETIMIMKMSAIDLFSIGLFTPTYYDANGVLGSGQSITIPEDKLFVLGDNSSDSLDSRGFEAMIIKYKDGSCQTLPIGADYKENAEFQGQQFYPFVDVDEVYSKAFAVFKPIQLARLIN